MPRPTKQELIDHIESLVAKCAELTRERDEARREILESMHPDLRESYTAAREWNCCKKNAIVSEPKRAVPPKFDLNEDEKS